MNQATELNATSSTLLLPGDPPAWELLNGDSDNGMVILCDHARNLIPTALDSLGLDKDQFENHIAYDIGAEDTARRLADLFRCRLFISGYSRLVIDLNRHPGDGSSIPEVSDDIEITGNRGLTTEEIICRENELFWAYHNRVSQELQQIASAGLTPLILSLHSFTPTYRGYRRPWHVGVLWDRDQRISAPLLQRLSALPDICAGDNEPYHARSPLGYTMEVHCEHNGFPHVLLELRQDLIESREGACHWGEFIHRHLSAVLDETGLLTTTGHKPGRP